MLYKIVARRSPDLLAEAVSEMMTHGYRPFGSPFTVKREVQNCNIPTLETVFCQAVIKPKERRAGVP
jgi:hypothetical protein